MSKNDWHFNIYLTCRRLSYFKRMVVAGKSKDAFQEKTEIRGYKKIPHFQKDVGIWMQFQQSLESQMFPQKMPGGLVLQGFPQKNLKLTASSPPWNGETGRPYGFLWGVGGLFSVANSLGGFEEGKFSSLGMVSPPMNLWVKNLHHLKVGHFCSDISVKAAGGFHINDDT